MKKFLAVAAVAAAVAMVAVGCGNAQTGNGGSGNDAAGSFDTSNMIAVVSREDGSGTRGAFVELTGVEADGVDNTVQTAIIGNSNSVVMTTVAGDEYSIGYSSIGALNDTVRAVPIDGVEATEDNAANGSYVLVRPFNVATKDLNNAAAQDFLDFIMSDEGQKVVTEAGYISASSTGAFAGGNVEGRVVVGGSTSVAPVMEKLIAAYNEINPGVDIEMQVAGSSAGMTGVLDGNFDLGMASRDLSESEKESGLEPVIIAKDGIAVIVHPDNSIDSLTMEQVKEIFTGTITVWDEVKN